MHYALAILRKASAADTPNIDSAGATSEFAFPEGPVLLKRCGIVVTTAVDPDNTVAMTAALSRRPIIGSSSGALAIGNFKIMAAAATNLAVGSVVYKDLHTDDADGETPEDYDATSYAKARRFEAPNSNMTPYLAGKDPMIIAPGQSFCMTLDTNAEADSGAVYSWVEYELLPLVADSVIVTGTVFKDVSEVA